MIKQMLATTMLQTDGQQQEYIKLIGAEVNTRNLREVVILSFIWKNLEKPSSIGHLIF